MLGCTVGVVHLRCRAPLKNGSGDVGPCVESHVRLILRGTTQDPVRDGKEERQIRPIAAAEPVTYEQHPESQHYYSREGPCTQF